MKDFFHPQSISHRSIFQVGFPASKTGPLRTSEGPDAASAGGRNRRDLMVLVPILIFKTRHDVMVLIGENQFGAIHSFESSQIVS